VTKMPQSLLTVLTVLLLIFVASIYLLPVLINPNDYKTEIAAFIKEKTNRAVVFEGDIQASVFPCLAISTENIKVSNALGFEALPFITVAKGDITLKWLPLLMRKVEINAVILDGLTINLIKDKQGINNWGDLIAIDSASQSNVNLGDEQTIKPFTLATSTVDSIVIQNAQVNWNDLKTGKHLELKNIRFNADNFRFGGPFKIDMAADFSGEANKFPGTIKFITTLGIDEKLESFVFNDSQIEWDGLQKMASGQLSPAIIFVPNMEANLARQAMKVTNLKLQYSGFRLMADMEGEHILDKLVLQGSVIIPEFNPREIIKQWDADLLGMSASKAMTNMGMSFHFQTDNTSAQINDLGVVVDNSNGKGFLTINDFSQPSLLFDLTVDTFDVDRYLSTQDKPAETSGNLVSMGTFSPFLNWLKQLDAEGKLTLGQMTFNKLTMQDICLTLSTKKGVVKVGQQPMKNKTLKPSIVGSF
jgi:AsmA protein